MSDLEHPLRFNVGFIVAEAIGFSREFLVEARKLQVTPDLLLQNVSGRILVTRTAEGLLVQCKLASQQEAECARCLDLFMLPIVVDFSELYSFLDHVISETELVLPYSGTLDLRPIIREYVVLETPLRTLCKTDCKGLCPVCGENLNNTVCHHNEDPVDPRLSVLKDLLNKE
jgi:uncharacterized protein